MFFRKASSVNKIFVSDLVGVDPGRYELADKATIDSLQRGLDSIRNNANDADILQLIIRTLPAMRTKAQNDRESLKRELQEYADYFVDIIKSNPDKADELQRLLDELNKLKQAKNAYVFNRVMPVFLLSTALSLLAILQLILFIQSTVVIPNIILCVLFMRCSIPLIILAVGLFNLVLTVSCAEKVSSWASELYDDDISNLQQEIETLSGVAFPERPEFAIARGINLENIDAKYDAIINNIDKSLQLYEKKLSRFSNAALNFS